MIKSLILQLLRSKKFVVSLVAVIVWIGGRVGFNIDPDLLFPVIGSLVAYVLGQGWADSGKEAAKISVEASKLIAAANIASGSGDKDMIRQASESLAPPPIG